MDKPTRNMEAGYPLTDLRDDYGEAWKYIEHLEGMLGAGNLCAFQMVLKQGSESDMQMRSRETAYTEMSAAHDGGDEIHLSNALAVLISDEDGLSVWRFYRKAGH